jgi:hypothetical protein
LFSALESTEEHHHGTQPAKDIIKTALKEDIVYLEKEAV